MQKSWGLGLAAVAVALSLTACAPSSSGASATPTETKQLTVVVHDSFNVSQPLLDRFKAETGYTVSIAKSGDAGGMTNKLILTKDAPSAAPSTASATRSPDARSRATSWSRTNRRTTPRTRPIFPLTPANASPRSTSATSA